MQTNDVPILIIIFNRPDKVRQLIDSLSCIKPSKIYITADGPRPTHAADQKLCEDARRIATDIPWQCEIFTNFSDLNLGCKIGVSTGISWFFAHETEGIILEDDCLPDPSFFPFCAEMLEKYRHESQIMHINGTSFLPTQAETPTEEDYYFSHISHSWGWATWKRAWEHFDVDMQELPKLKKVLQDNGMFLHQKHVCFWQKLLLHIKYVQADSWANPWQYTILINNGLCITPIVNLIDNIGFDTDATHTTKTPKFIQHTRSLGDSDIAHPANVTAAKEYDATVMDTVYVRRPLQRALSLLQKWYHSYT